MRKPEIQDGRRGDRDPEIKREERDSGFGDRKWEEGCGGGREGGEKNRVIVTYRHRNQQDRDEIEATTENKNDIQQIIGEGGGKKNGF